jgi:Cft2 family RNA processing exonuclease
MVRWAVMESLPKGFIPGYKTDSLGNAQEIISIFNQMTNLPVITSKSATIMSDIYQKYGFNLDYIDSKSNEGQRLLKDGRCVLVAPKGSKLGIPKLDMALASGWASIMGKRRRSFPLSDHVDYKGLLSFIRKCRPRRVLTFHGGSMTRNFYQDIKRVLGIDANPLTTIRENIHGPIVKAESRIRNCSRQILRTIKIPGFIYTEDWLVREMAQCGFNRTETKNSLKFLIHRGIIAEGDGGLKLA